MPRLRLALSTVAAAMAAAGSLAAQEAPVRAGPSPDSTPACAGAVPAPPAAPVAGAPLAPATPPAPRPPLPPATTPAPIRAGAMAKHDCFLVVAKRGGIDLLFVGDSITDFFLRADRGQAVWNAHYGAMKAADFGISGDTTQDVLGRIQSGELDGFSARLIVLMLGTNNIGRNDSADIVAGDAAIIAEFRRRQPGARILMLGVFPRGEQPDNPARATIRDINAGLAKLADDKTVFYLDIGDKFLEPDGVLTKAVMADGLHPTTHGYEIWADAVDPTIKRLLR